MPWAEVSSRFVTPHDNHKELVSSLLLAGLIETEPQGMVTITARGRELLTALDVPLLDPPPQTTCPLLAPKNSPNWTDCSSRSAARTTELAASRDRI